ncbi:MAG: YfiR family protein [Kiritimatiellae bacterium]|nr:YfiR family protein [Kiritimatiellia bacterium]
MRARALSLLAVGLMFPATCLICQGAAGRYAEAPGDVQAAVLLKILGFNENLRGDITIYVLGSKDFTEQMDKAVGRALGTATLAHVSAGNVLPQATPDVLYVGDSDLIDEALAYTRDHKIISITGNPALVKKGVTLGVATDLDDGKPAVLLNPGASKLEGVRWNPVVMKFVVIYE